jgi:RHS repeat-associated protein
LTDALGSTIKLADGSGSIQTEYTYEPFGSVTTSGSANGNTFGFTGRENDGTGLNYYRARYYDPELHRFTAEDPIRQSGGLNLHRYANNAPTFFTDPMGWKPPEGFGPEGPTGPGSDGQGNGGGGAGGPGNGEGGSGTSALGCFAGNFNFAWKSTNRYFFDGWWRISRTAIGLASAGTVARALGSHTFLQAYVQHGLGGFSIRGAVPGLGYRGTAISVGRTVITNTITVTTALEAGITVGSAADALGQTIAGYCR